MEMAHKLFAFELDGIVHLKSSWSDMSSTVLSPQAQLKGLLCSNVIEYQPSNLDMSTLFIQI